MHKVVILGFGNVGNHLYQAMNDSESIHVIQVYNRTEITSEISQTQHLSEIKDADVYIVALPDDAIGSFTERLPFNNKLVVHTSGGVRMEALSTKNRKGVFYPLQTFSKNKEVNFKNIPICIEAESEKDLKALESLGQAISDNVVEISSSEREQLHLAAVFVNNFTNHLYHIAEKITGENQLDFNLLKPLIAETASKIESLSPFEAQTGPAKRGDKKTIEKHLELLKNTKYTELYTQLSNSIQEEFD